MESNDAARNSVSCAHNMHWKIESRVFERKLNWKCLDCGKVVAWQMTLEEIDAD